MNQILVKPIITEKSMQDAATNQFTFEVKIWANKAQIADSITKAFGVKVVDVKTTTVKGETRRAGKRRQKILTQPTKKAIVELVKGQKIDLFDTTEHVEKT